VKRLAFGAPLVALVCLALVACEQKADPAAGSTSAKASTTAAANTTAAAAQPGAQDDPPTEQDFEDEAEKTITSANVDSELEKLEKEIGK